MANFTESEDQVDVEVEDLFKEQAEEPQIEDNLEPEGEQELPAVEEEPELPSKYRGKSVTDIIKMHQEAEKLIGRQAQEVGEVRKLADDLIKRQLEGGVKTQEEATKEDETSLYEDPEGYLNKKLESHPAILEAKQQALQIKQMQIAQRLANEFPGYQEVVNSPGFGEWVQASPVRMKLFAEAHNNFDYDSAAELLSNYNYVKGVKTQQTASMNKEVATQDRKQSLKAAAVNTGSVGVESKKTYRREDIRNLMLRDPARYQEMQPELMAAYAEGRVIGS